MKQARKLKACVTYYGMADTKLALFREREKIMNEFPGYKMMGSSLSDNTIKGLCDLVLRSVRDLNSTLSVSFVIGIFVVVYLPHRKKLFLVCS